MTTKIKILIFILLPFYLKLILFRWLCILENRQNLENWYPWLEKNKSTFRLSEQQYHTYLHIYVYMHICIHILYVYTHIHRYLDLFICIYMYIYMRDTLANRKSENNRYIIKTIQKSFRKKKKNLEEKKKLFSEIL